MRVLSFIYLNSGHFGPEYKPMLGFNATELMYFTISSRLIFLDQTHQCTALQGTMCMMGVKTLGVLTINTELSCFYFDLKTAQLMFWLLKNLLSPPQILTGYVSLHCPKLSAMGFWSVYQLTCFVPWGSSKLMVKKILAFSNTACTEGHVCPLCIHPCTSYAYPGTLLVCNTLSDISG